MEWATIATGPNFPGDPTSFSALSTKAIILYKLTKDDAGAAVIKTALPLGNVGQLQQFGRQLIAAKYPKVALEVFQFNYAKNPEHFAALMGMVRGLSANEEFAKALEFANKALLVAPNENNKQAVQVMIDKLKANKDVN